MKKLKITWILAVLLVPQLVLISCGGGDDEIIEDDPVEETVTAAALTTSIDENPANGLEVGIIAATTTKGTVTFSLTNEQPAGALSIHASTGKLTVKDSALFDYEKRSTVTAVAEATNGSRTATAQITISIKDFVAPKAGLVAAYTFDAGNAEDEVGSNDGVVTRASLTADRFGAANKAYAFAGDAYIDFGDDPTFRISGDYSISFWLKPNGQSQHSPVLYKRDNGNANYIQYNFSFFDNPYIGGDSKYLKLFMRAEGGGDVVLSSAAELTNTWYHVTLTHSSAGLTEMYLNGTFQQSGTDTGTYKVEGNPLRIGGNPETGKYLTGEMDNIFFYNRVLSAKEIGLLSQE